MKSTSALRIFFLALFVTRMTHARSPAAATSDLGATAQSSSSPSPSQATSFEITGVVRAGKTPLPGVTVTAANTLTGKKFSLATAANGTYTFTGLPRGRYVVRVEFMGFAPETQEVVLKAETSSGKFDAELILASRQQEQTNNVLASTSGGRGFQSLALDSVLSSLAGGGMGGGGNG